ncbi:MAG TPA: Piwi domain-containing protein [Bacteroidales bacterium]|nr:Piwi domain-containing protein [Bacteroidales bacterium]
MQHLQLNIIPFSAPADEVEFSFYQQKKPGYLPVFKADFAELLENHFSDDQLEGIEKLYTNFQPSLNGGLPLKINLHKSPRVACHYYRFLIRQYFTGIADMVRQNFTSETEVWFLNPESKSPQYKVYNQFTIKVQYNHVSGGPELVLSYDGTTKVYNKSIAEIPNFKTEYYNWINCDGVLNRWIHLTDEQKLHHEKNYPVLSNALKPHLGISFDVPDFKNRYPRYFKLLNEFYSKYLDTDEFRKIIPLSKDGFIKVADEKIQRINGTSNELQFGLGVGNEPKRDLRRLKPYKPVPGPNNVKFFFIYHKPDKEFAVKTIWQYLKDGFKGNYTFPRMEEYISLPFELEPKDQHICFDNIDEAVSVVHKAIKNKDKIPGAKYMAIYISPVPKWETDPNRRFIYHRLKEILLYEGISSQVIWKENIAKPSFNLFLPNIETAILAKLGGIPWRLKRDTTNELIVGVGAFYSITHKTKFVGSAFCFNNDGLFRGFDCFSANDTYSIAGSIREAVGKFIAANYKATRLIIHFYKDLGKHELKPIMETLHALGLPIPVIVLTINKTESKDYLAFDINSPDKFMPYSGTIVKLADKEYLLFNNTRYTETSIPTEREYHFPVKISFFSSQPALLDDQPAINELIDQVYQFSRMYWKSISQQSLPVTIKYPEMVARIYPHFQNDKLPYFGKESLWFL